MIAPLLALLLACDRPPEPPSVLLVTLDTTRADHLGPYGGAARTPTWDAVAAAGTTFTRAYAVAPLTIPAHSSILTGLYPPEHGVLDNGSFVLGDDVVTIAERLRDQGYVTAAFTAAFPTHRRWGLSQGFSTYDDPLPGLPTERDWRDQRRADEVVDAAIAGLDGVDGPVFAWVHLFDAHWPYDPPDGLDGYDGEITYADAQAGRLLDVWEADHPDSIVVVVGDHGEGLGDGGERTHGFLLHDGTIRVPLLLRGPGVESGLRVSDPVSQVDIVPTILALCGLPADPSLSGRDLRDGGSDLPLSEARTGQYALGLAPLFAATEPDGRATEGAWPAWYPAIDDRISTEPEAREVDALLRRLRALEAGMLPRAMVTAETADAELAALGYAAADPDAPAGDIDPREVIDVIPLTWAVSQAIGRGQLDVAARDLDVLEKRLPEAWGVRLLRARWNRRRGDADAAMSTFYELYAESPSPSVALDIAAAWAAIGEPEEAESWFREVLARSPSDPDAMVGLVRSLADQGRGDEAIELAEPFLAAVPDHAGLAELRAELLLADDRADEAVVEADRAVRAMPASASAWATLGRARWARGDADPGLDALHEALRLDPTDVGVRLDLADGLLEARRAAEAARVLAPLGRMHGDTPAVERRVSQARAALAPSGG